MSFSRLISVIVVTAAVGVQAVPQTVNTLSTVTTVAPTIITGDKMGAAIFLDGYNATEIVYQAEDTSIHSLTGSGPPSSGSSYSSSVILAAGVARNDTSLALAVDNQIVFTVEHLFYLSATECNGGNYFHELPNDPYHGWIDGGLNALEICSSSASNFLCALGGQRLGGLNQLSSPFRVGYVRADNTLGEAYEASSGWTTVQF